VLVRGTTAAALAQILLAAATTSTPLTVSLRPDARVWPWLAESAEVAVESEAGFVDRLAQGGVDRVRAWEPVSTAARAAAGGTGVTIIDAPVLATGRLELRWYLREQAVSRILHRYGSVTEPVPPA